MSPDLTFEETFAAAPPDALVSFSVVCQPKSGADLVRLRRELSLRTIKELTPTPEVRASVARQLKDKGFEVFEGRGPVVTARGTVQQFQAVFGGKLVKRTRVRATYQPDRTRTVTSIVLSEDSERPSPRNIAGALLVAVAQAPDPATPSIPPVVAGFHLRVPGDIAQLTRASATHRRTTGGKQATGAGVAVAVVDTGFGKHPYYKEHGYRITPLAAADTSNPTDDDEPHGTLILSGLLACAPDVHVFGIKYGVNPVTALDEAMNGHRVKVISLSWAYNLPGVRTIPEDRDDLLALETSLLDIIDGGVTVVVAGGNGTITSFPAMMPDVIAVGGVAVNAADGLAVWGGSSSFKSLIYRGRTVPDVCGFAERTLLPIPAMAGAPAGWDSALGGTSLATCQVAGIAALLLQKTPTLTPSQVRDALMSNATDVVAGTSAFGDMAGAGPDLATGAGFVNALTAWNSV